MIIQITRVPSNIGLKKTPPKYISTGMIKAMHKKHQIKYEKLRGLIECEELIINTKSKKFLTNVGENKNQINITINSKPYF